MLKQISVFVENKRGRLSHITGLLSAEDINIVAISIADTTNFGILRMVVDRPEDALPIIEEAGYTVSKTDVLAIEVSDDPGGVHMILDILNTAGMSVEYLYSYLRTDTKMAVILFKVDDNQKAIERLKEEKVRILTRDELMELS